MRCDSLIVGFLSHLVDWISGLTPTGCLATQWLNNPPSCTPCILCPAPVHPKTLVPCTSCTLHPLHIAPPYSLQHYILLLTPCTTHILHLSHLPATHLAPGPFASNSLHLLPFTPNTTHSSVCWRMICRPHTQFKTLKSIQSLYCKLGLLIIKVPKAPLYHVKEFSASPKSVNKLTLNEPTMMSVPSQRKLK